MYKKFKLSNGTRIIMEKIPHVKSISLGIWVNVGSVDETVENNGITHFIEHMLFKGTKNRSAKEIAAAIDDIGGQLNAFTGKECTCYYAKVLDSHINIAVDVLSDMVFNSSLDEREIEKEKNVVLEEISMYEDSPEENAHDLLFKTIYKDDSLGYPILGTRDIISNLTRDKLVEHMEKFYVPENMVISVAGNFDEKYLINMLEEKIISIGKKKNIQLKNDKEKPNFNREIGMKYKDIEQLHLCIGLESFSMGSENVYPLLVMNTIFGGSMSSRLFQNIREDKGLAYSVFSYPTSYRNSGIFTIYAGINPKQLEKVCLSIREEIDLIKNKGLGKEELLKAKEQLKGSYILGLEGTSSRMMGIGKSELLLNRVYTQKEVLDKIDNIEMDHIKRVIDKIFSKENMSVSLVGNIDKDINIKKYLY
ncbi:MAG: insulinase family protein [Anaeromicrobium sp.]|jgi:predicted Zn-dependent peptidase|uniref:M16 family metallopeptidase n=1 Tax=Anaeromicrobium sp. TaxID=1929132 RepID=UPI0025DAD642|nr:pitrilysin family protein [Anaeromicrobium sp.]MCT4594667.1 insulinase family protein [Anaeromicrobium sp.]